MGNCKISSCSIIWIMPDADGQGKPYGFVKGYAVDWKLDDGCFVPITVYSGSTRYFLCKWAVGRFFPVSKYICVLFIVRNRFIAVAWDVKARAAYAEGDFASVNVYKKEAISQARYSLEEYEDYFEMLKTGVELYRKSGDKGSVEICLEEIEMIQVMLDELEEQTDSLAYRIKDKRVQENFSTSN